MVPALPLGGEAIVAEALEQITVVELDGGLGAAVIIDEARFEGRGVEKLA